MRQPQHRNRARTRTRRQPNPANKVYESNGPDVKVRGTPQQIADKYAQLGRDALSAGDMVKAENYFQHAEHYLRIIAAAQEQLQQRRQQQEQRRQEAAARRRGNGRDAQPDVPARDADNGADDVVAGGADDAAANGSGAEGAQVVVLPTEATEESGDAAAPAASEADGATGGAEAEVQPAWEGSAPQFLTRPVEVLSDDAEDAARPSDGDGAPARDDADSAAASAAEGEARATTGTTRRAPRRRATRTRRSSGSGTGNGKPEASDA